nr:VWA domain-containing protein [Lachnospiraceae bacterium]
MNNFKATKLRRATAFLMSLIVSFSTFASDSALLKAYAADSASSVTSSVTNEGNTDVSVTKNAVIDGEGNVTITFDVENKTTNEDVVTSTDAEIIFVVDTSGSMTQNNKMEAVKAAALDFAKDIFDANKGDNIKLGVLPFNKDSERIELDDNYDDVAAAINLLNAEYGTGTNLQSAIHSARESFSDSDCKKIMVLLTDGSVNYSYQGDTITRNKVRLNSGEETYLVTNFPSYEEIFRLGDGSNYGYGTGYGSKKYTVTQHYYLDKQTQEEIEEQYVAWDKAYNTGVDIRSHYEAVVKNRYNSNNSTTDWGYLDKNGQWKSSYFNSNGRRISLTRSDRGNTIVVYDKEVKKVDYSLEVANNGVPTVSEAYLAKNEGIEVYTIAYGYEKFDTNIRKFIDFVMTNSASSTSKYSKANTAAESISAIVKSITEKVNKSIELARGTKIVDILPEYLKVTGATAAKVGDGKAPDAPSDSYLTTPNKVEWSLGEANHATLTINAKIDVDKLVEITGHDLSYFADGKEINLNGTVTVTYRDINENPKEDTRISGSNVPTGIVKTYPYTISYTLDGEPMADYPTVSGYALKGQTIDIATIPTGNYGEPVVKRGQETITKSTDGGYHFAVAESNNDVIVALSTASHTVSFYGGADGKTFISKATVEHGASAAEFEPTADKIPAVEGKHFTGWNTTFTEIVDDLDVI